MSPSRFKLSSLIALSLGALLLCCSYFFYQATGLAAFPFGEPQALTGEIGEAGPGEKEEAPGDSAMPEITDEPEPLPPPPPPPPPPPQPDEAILIAVGDIMVHQTQFVQAYDRESDSYDFTPSFEYIYPYLQRADLAVGNLETTLAGAARGFRAYPRFNSPDEMATALRGAGFDLLCTANNHSMDSGEEGVYRTLEIVEAEGLKPFGTARSREERDTPLLVEVNGIKLAFLAYSYCTNGIPLPSGREYIVNLFDRELMQNHIDEARRAGADLVIVYMHWGWEYRTEANPEQKDLARFLAAAGANIIIGSHPHVIQPMEYLSFEDENGEEQQAFVAYSLGNFISNQHLIPGAVPTHEVQYGMLLRLHLRRDAPGEAAYLKDVDYKLTWVNRAERHRITPLPAVTEDLQRPPTIPEAKWPQIRQTAITLQERLAPFAVAEVESW